MTTVTGHLFGSVVFLRKNTLFPKRNSVIPIIVFSRLFHIVANGGGVSLQNLIEYAHIESPGF